jgi:hypothetical protein
LPVVDQDRLAPISWVIILLHRFSLRLLDDMMQGFWVRVTVKGSEMLRANETQLPIDRWKRLRDNQCVRCWRTGKSRWGTL